MKTMSLVKVLTTMFMLAMVNTVNCIDKLFFLQNSTSEGREALLVVSWYEQNEEIYATCDVISGSDKINEALESADNPPVETITEEDMENYLKECDSINDSESEEGKVYNAPKPKGTTTDPETTTVGYDGIPVIFPGTKWCGAGDRAKHYNDLGLHQDTDRCCRAHDLCNDTLAPGETRNALTNKSKFTKLSCQCDEDFYNCLDKVNTVTSNTIGNMYFNILKRDCYKEDYPNTNKCKKYRSIFKIKCIEYEKDTKAKKIYDWNPAKKYRKIPFPGPLTVTLPNILPF